MINDRSRCICGDALSQHDVIPDPRKPGDERLAGRCRANYGVVFDRGRELGSYWGGSAADRGRCPCEEFELDTKSDRGR
jgi:hypothetical protein